MFIAGEERRNIISYVDLSRIFHVIKCFPDLKRKFGKEDITFILSSISISIEWQKNNLSEL